AGAAPPRPAGPWRRAGPRRACPRRAPRRWRPPRPPPGGCASRRSSRLIVHDLGVDDLLVGLARGRAVGGRAVPVAVRRRGGLLRLGALVHRLGDLVERGLEALGAGADVGGVLGGQRLADVLDRLLDLGLRGVVELLLEVLDLALGLV